ncbi:MAG: transcriptional regulator with XRE-family HTH domain [Polyangiales bacterium]
MARGTPGENLARNIKELRAARGLSQQQLAKASSIPRATWATLETGGSNPTLSVLLKVAAALSVSIEELISTPRQTGKLHKLSALRAKKRGKVEVRDLVPEALPGTQLERMHFPPGASMTGIPHTKGTREYFCCERGSITLAAGGEEWTLEEGDVVVFRGDQKHSYRNVGRKNAIAYSVVLPGRGPA